VYQEGPGYPLIALDSINLPNFPIAIACEADYIRTMFGADGLRE
jgi:hypothetical protein